MMKSITFSIVSLLRVEHALYQASTQASVLSSRLETFALVMVKSKPIMKFF